MFKVPFETVLSPVVFQEIDEARRRLDRREFRVHPITQADLFLDGCQQPPAGNAELPTGSYTGNKWGGKYLRAPDIYWIILEKGKGKLVRLGDIADVRRGITTGANEFFYLDDAKIKQWGIEAQFLKPVIKSPRECKSLLIDPKDLKYKIFMCHKTKAELAGTAALQYINWGESQGSQSGPTCASRPLWWDVGFHGEPTHLWQKSVNNRHIQAQLPFGSYADQRLYEIEYRSARYSMAAVLNGAVLILAKEISSRVNLGEGALDTAVYEAKATLIVTPSRVIESEAEMAVKPIEARRILSITEELQRSDRRALDDTVFDVLGLTRGERDAVYEAVIDLVEKRLAKAKSLGKG